jgi:phosphate transport system protein
MPRTHFQQELQQLRDEILIMASMVQQQLLDAVEALSKSDLDAAKRIIAQDMEINRKRFLLEDETLTLIATQAPMAGDMRFLAGCLEVISELERIGDYAKGISRISLMLGRDSGVVMPEHLEEMCELAISMLRDAIDAFVSDDLVAAREIPQRDDLVDALYNKTNLDLIQLIMDEPHKMARANLFSWAAHNIERTGDRSTNICERTIYMVTGEMRELDRSEEELSGLN